MKSGKKDQDYGSPADYITPMVRSVLSVIAGIAALTVSSFAIEAVLNSLLLRTFPNTLPTAALSSNPWVRTLTFAYGLLCVAGGGYLAARLARRRPIQHAAAMAIVQAVLTIVAMLSTVGNHASRWVWIATAFLTIPAALVGGYLYKVRLAEKGLEKTVAGL